MEIATFKSLSRLIPWSGLRLLRRALLFRARNHHRNHNIAHRREYCQCLKSHCHHPEGHVQVPQQAHGLGQLMRSYGLSVTIL